MQAVFASACPVLKTNDFVAHITHEGWYKSTVAEIVHSAASPTENIAKLLGEPIAGRAGQTTEALMPTRQAEANANSLSKTHGLGSFPIHTDGAHRIQPPRFVMLVCISPGACPVPTILIRFRDLQFTASERTQLEATPFLFRNGRQSFYSTICSPTRTFIRFDQGCMVPQGSEGKASAKLVVDRANNIGFNVVQWQKDDVLFIDNWNVMHGRGYGVSETSYDRKPLRVSVN